MIRPDDAEGREPEPEDDPQTWRDWQDQLERELQDREHYT